MKFDSIWTLILIALAIIMVAVIAIVFSKAAHTDGKRAKYDERQLVARGRGYKYAFFTSVIVAMLPIFMTEEMKHMLGDALYWIPLIVGLCVHIYYCIWKDAYLEINLDSKKWMTSMAFISIANILICIGSCREGFLTKGVLNTGVINLVIGIFGICIIVELMIKKSIDNKKEADEDEELEA